MRSASALTIAPDHPALAGHFPGVPVVPGVVLLDEALYAIEHTLQVPVAECTLMSAKFLGVVHPGEPLVLELERLANADIRFSFYGRGHLLAHGIVHEN